MLRARVAFTQQGLGTLPVFDVAAIDGFQIMPFFAMEPAHGPGAC
jgi:hypothetical protein